MLFGQVGAVIAQRYQIIEVLPGGNHSKVYRAKDLERPELASLVVKCAKESDQEILLRQEIDILRQLNNHPNIVTYYTSGRCPEYGLYYVMEYVKGLGLDQAGQLDAQQIIEITRQICQGLEQLHTKRILHLDLKGSNLIYDDDNGTIRLIDFSTAHASESNSGEVKLPAGFVTTVEIMAPEWSSAVLTNKQSFLAASPKWDIFALGILLYRLCGGTWQVPGHTIEQRLTWLARQYQLPVLPARTPLELISLLNMMLSVQPERRPTAAEILAALPPRTARSGQYWKELPLLGRTEEKTQLIKRIAQLIQIPQLPRSLTLSGVPGVGKSRLIEETQQSLQSHGYFTAYEKVTARDVKPFTPLVRLLRYCLDYSANDQVSREANSLAALLQILTTEDTQTTQVGNQDNTVNTLYTATLNYLEKAFATQATFLYLDDAHLAEQSLLKFLRDLQVELGNHNIPVVIGLGFRPSSENKPAERELDIFQTPDLTLTPLDKTTIEKLIEEGFGLLEDGLGRRADLVDHIYKCSGGLPLFIREQLRLFVSQGVLKINPEKNTWVINPQAELHKFVISPEIGPAQIMNDRIKLLDHTTQNIVRLAALIEADLRDDLWKLIAQGVQEISADQFEHSRQKLLQEDILQRLPSSNRYQFSHDLLYRAALNGADYWRTAVGKILQTEYKLQLNNNNSTPDKGLPFELNTTQELKPVLAHLSVLASCYTNSGSYRSACGYNLLTAERAVHANAYNRAIENFGKVLDQIDYAEYSDEEDDIEFLEDTEKLVLTQFYTYKGLTLANLRIGRYEQANRDVERTEQLAEQYRTIITDELMADFYNNRVQLLTRQRRYEDLIKLIEAPFMQTLESRSAIEARLISYQALHKIGYDKEAREYAQRELELAEKINSSFGKAKCHNLFCMLDKYNKDYESAIQHVTVALQIFKELDDLDQILRAQANLAIIYGDMNEWEKSRFYMEHNLETMEKYGIREPLRLFQTYNGLGEYYRSQNIFDLAQKNYEKARDVADELKDAESKGLVLINLGAVYTETDISKAHTFLQNALDIFSANHITVHLSELYIQIARYWIKVQQPEQANQFYQLALDWARKNNKLKEVEEVSLQIAQLQGKLNS